MTACPRFGCLTPYDGLARLLQQLAVAKVFFVFIGGKRLFPIRYFFMKNSYQRKEKKIERVFEILK